MRREGKEKERADFDSFTVCGEGGMEELMVHILGGRRV